MTEHFLNIEDETFPSFLVESLTSNGEILENVTFSSNLGMPVAASTIAKERTISDARLPNVQSSYLEDGRFSLVAGSFHSSQSDGDSRGKFAVSLKDEPKDLHFIETNRASGILHKSHLKETELVYDVPKEIAAYFSSHSLDTSLEILPLEDMQDLSIGLCTLSLKEKRDNKGKNIPRSENDLYEDAGYALGDNLNTSLSSFLENENLLSVASLDASFTDDDLDDALYDEQLEAYFKQLVPPGMQRGDTEREELPEANAASLLANHDDDQVGESNMPSFRSGLEGGSSDEECCGRPTVSNDAELDYRRSAEGEIISLSLPGNGSDIVVENSESECDGNAGQMAMVPVSSILETFETWGSEIVERDMVREENDHIESPPQDVRDFVPGYSKETMDNSEKLNARRCKEKDTAYEPCSNVKTTFNLSTVASMHEPPSKYHLSKILSFIPEEFHLSDQYYDASEMHTKENTDIANMTSVGKNEPGLADAYLSPSHKIGNEYQDTSDKWQLAQEENINCGMEDDENEKGTNSPHSIVYQNEEGKWVTDLAYYTSFDKEQDLDVATALNDEDFITGLDAIEMIAEDEREFEREHRFIQGEKMDLQNTSLGQGDTWKMSANNCLLLRASQVISDDEDASYLRLSLGEFFGQRSEALGCLGGGFDVKRPSFGYHITSPEKQEPITLLRSSDTSRTYSGHDTIRFDDTLFPEDLGLLNDQPKTGSVTFDIKQMDSPSKIEKNVNTREIDPLKKKKELYIDVNKPDEMKQIQGTESMLSISTIASAIANASASADPSQLATMIMALSNKNRKKIFESSHEMDTTLMSQILSGTLEKSHAIKSFDMERYLKKTDFINQETAPESFVINEESLQDFTWDMSLIQKQNMQHPISVDMLNRTYCKKSDYNLLLDSKETLSENTVSGIQATNFTIVEDKTNDNKSLSVSNDKAVEHTDSNHRTSFSRNVQTSNTKELDAVSSGTNKRECLSKLNINKERLHQRTSDTKPVNMKECLYDLATSRAHRRSLNMMHEESNRREFVKDAATEIRLSSLKQLIKNQNVGNIESELSHAGKEMENLNLVNSSCHSSCVHGSRSSSPVQCNPSTAGDKKSNIVSSISGPNSKPFQVLSKNREIEDVGNSQKFKCETSSSVTEKHISFEKHSNLSFPQNTAQSESHFPENVNCPDDEQYSFRPSTSPLIHSSPSQVVEMTAASGAFGDSSISTASPLQRPACSDNLSSQSSSSSPSISRLTYISATDSTLQETTVMPSPENQCNKTIELSTTIVRASPTPPEEHTSKYSEENLAWQNVGQTSEDTNSRKTSQTGSECKIPTGKTDEISPNELFKEPSPKGNQSESSLSSSFKEQRDSINAVLPSKSRISCQALSINTDTPLVWQEFTDKVPNPGLSPLNMLPADSGLGVCASLTESIPIDQYIPISSFKSFNVSDMQPIPSAVPTLLTGRSLSSTAFAQQYLGTVSSVGTVTLPQYQVNSSAGYCVSPGFPGSMQGGHIQNSVTIGIPVGSNVHSGLSTSSVYNTHPCSVNHNIMNSYTGHHGTGGLQHWGTRMTSGFGTVLVPEEFKFPNACCVGIASQTSLSMYNPSERWLQVSIGILSVTVNGEKMDSLTYQCLVFKNKTIIGPHAAEDMKMLFMPHCSGIFHFVLNVSSWPVSADAETIVRSEALAVRVVLTAVAENPLIEVDVGKADGLDFGDLTSGSWKALPLKLINKTHATVPIRLIISANAAAWHCFMFSKEPVKMSADHILKADLVSQLAAPSVINHVMHASFDGQDPEVLVIWILFHGPQKYLSAADSLGPAEEFLARVDVEIDSPGPTNIIKSVPLKARTGTARIHAPKDLQTIHLCARVGLSTKQCLPLKNAGNIAVQLKLQPSDQGNSFSVKPENLFLVPGEEQDVEVSFSPQNSQSYKESVLKIFVEPSGPQYEVVLKGEVEIPGNIKSMTPGSALPTEVPPILSNKQFIAWAGVTLGRAVQQKLVLRNDSPSATQSLRLLIRGQDHDCFQLQNIFGPEERLTSDQELVIRPKEDRKIFIMFAPTRVACMLAKLEIKQLGLRSSQPGIKFTIPLSGYGGTSNIILEDVKKLLDNYVVTLNGISSGEVSKVQFCVRNTGSRAAFVKTICCTDIRTTTVMDPNVLSVSPEKFVLKERTQVVVTITCCSTRREQTLCTPNTALLATVCLFCGDEISRKQYRRALLHRPEAARKILSENSLLRNMKFDEEFQGEQLMTEVYDLPQRANDIQLFYGNIHKVILSVFGSIGGTGSNGPSCLPSPRPSLESDSGIGNSERNISNTSLDVLPVKGPQGAPLCSNIVESAHKFEQTWTIQPEHLILTASSISGSTSTEQVKLSNTTNRMLTFELSWPAHCLTITPQHGTIEPQSHILILVSPSPSFVTKSSVLPWSGQIYIHCDNGQKFIKVQIREDAVLDIPATRSSSKQLAMLSPHPRAPIHIAKPLIKLPSSVIEIKNRTLIFPKTASSESSETYLDVENLGSEDVTWQLSSFAPPYVKGVDESGEVYRATYTAFRCSRVSGVLEAHGKQQVAFTFFPRGRGDYSQFWDLEYYPSAEPHLRHKLRFQLCGEGIGEINGLGRVSAESLRKTEVPVKPRRRSGSEASALKLG
ncbi:centrosomal protein of 192 kDa isoform X2 [Rhinatrema bivittatum]|nr:centrosomal protein of 192 kDa isoform X2 [Rhinatrema bivittatum]